MVPDRIRRGLVTVAAAVLLLGTAAPALAAPNNPSLQWCHDHAIGLRTGDHGPCVKTVQAFLRFAVGGRDVTGLCPTYASRVTGPLPITLDFDDATRRHLRCFQEWQGIRPTGRANATTYRRMVHTCRSDAGYRGIPSGDPTDRSFAHYWFCDATARPVYLTFDDGPFLYRTPPLLSILAAKGVRVTFFVVGTNVTSYPAITERAFREGHSIQSHGHTHTYLTRLSDFAVRSELDRSAEAIHEAVGVWPTCLRPPYGAVSTRIRSIAEGAGYAVVMWTDNTGDYAGQTPSALLRQSRSWVGGDVVLGHDLWSNTWDDVLARIIDEARDRGLEFDVLCANPTEQPG